MSEPLSEDMLKIIALRVEACAACNGIGTAINCPDCLGGEVHTRCLEEPGPCCYCGGDGKSGDDEDAVALLREVRRLRKALNDRKYTPIDVAEQITKERDAARADLARAIEAMRLAVTNNDDRPARAFLAEMEKR